MTDELQTKIEIALGCFASTYSEELAFLKAGMTEEEISIVSVSEEYVRRKDIILIDEIEKSIETLRNHKFSENEQVSYKANIEWLMVLYPNFFNVKERMKKSLLDNTQASKLKDHIVEEPVSDNPKEKQAEQERIANELKLVLGGDADTKRKPNLKEELPKVMAGD